ncbi:MAG: class I SAM-dependent methyltransferase [Anaerolineales bacterium]
MGLFQELELINERPEPFEFYTAEDLWTDQHTSERMLAFHLDENSDLSSRKADFIDRSAAWIVEHFKVSQDTRIIDFGCGPGLYTTRLAQRGAQVTGIDFSASSIEYARETAAREGLDIRYLKQNYLVFDPEDTYDLILMIYCDFCALSPIQRASILSVYREILAPDGAILLDVYSLAAFNEREELAMYQLNQLDGFWSPNRYYGFLNAFKYEAEKVSLDKYTIIERNRIRTVYNWLQHFTPRDLEGEFNSAGLSFSECYSDVSGAPYDPKSPEFAVVARRL